MTARNPTPRLSQINLKSPDADVGRPNSEGGTTAFRGHFFVIGHEHGIEETATTARRLQIQPRSSGVTSAAAQVTRVSHASLLGAGLDAERHPNCAIRFESRIGRRRNARVWIAGGWRPCRKASDEIVGCGRRTGSCDTAVTRGAGDHRLTRRALCCSVGEGERGRRSIERIAEVPTPDPDQ
jgi:hypothetical protein